MGPRCSTFPSSRYWPRVSLVNLALLWVTLLADHRSSRSAIWSRLGPLPDAFQALVAATPLLALGLAVLVLVDGLVGILDALRQ